jgi:two-component system, cell cycle sensor histidine kinase and response regulator CckA
VLARSLEPEDPRHASAREVLAAGQRAADLTRQLLALSRRQVLEPRIVDVNLVVERMMSMLGRLVGERIEINLRLQRDAPATRIDPTQLEQVILNLVVNARDAMPGGGKLGIESWLEALDAAAARGVGLAPGAYVALLVSDTGFGMDAATQTRIFEPFFTTKEVGNGIGLGLSTAHGIATQSGGAIRVDSAPGQGARFFVYLPAAAAHASAAESRPLATARAGHETIVVAEDEPAVRRVIVDVLSGAGHRVVAGDSGVEVLRAAASAEGPIHLLITDFVMPGMTGLELASALSALCPGLRVLVLSGYSRHHQLPVSMQFLPKPFTADDLLAKVREVLDAKVLDGDTLLDGDTPLDNTLLDG